LEEKRRLEEERSILAAAILADKTPKRSATSALIKTPKRRRRG
jgi:hypothetical protein